MRKIFTLFIVVLGIQMSVQADQGLFEQSPFAYNLALVDQNEHLDMAARSNQIGPIPHRHPGYRPGGPSHYPRPRPGPGPRPPHRPGHRPHHHYPYGPHPRPHHHYPYGPHPRHHHWRPYPGPRRPLPGYGPFYPYCSYYPYSPRCYGYYGGGPYGGVSVGGGPLQFWIGF